MSGDTRFDRVLQIKEASKQLPIVERFVQGGLSDTPPVAASSQLSAPENLTPTTHHPSPVFVAGSSWLPDEEIFLKYFNLHPEWKLIIAPHVIGEEHLRQIVALIGEGRKVVRYTRCAHHRLLWSAVIHLSLWLRGIRGWRLRCGHSQCA